MAAIPPYIAELPLKAPEAGAFRLVAGQVLRARVATLQGDQAALDFGYASLTVKLAPGATLIPGQRVLLQVVDVGPQRLTISLLPEAMPAAVAPPAATSAQLLQSLGFPLDDPLLHMATQLQQQPAAQGVPMPLLAALILAYGPDAATLLPRIPALLQRRGTTPAPPPSAAVLHETAGAASGIMQLLQEILHQRRATTQDARHLAGHWQQAQQDPAQLLSLALSALSGHAVEYHGADDGSWTVIAEERGRVATAEAQVHRFLARLDLPSLGPVAVQALLTTAGCLARVTAQAERLGPLQSELDRATSALAQRLGRPVHLTTQVGVAESPLTMWLEELPWLSRGQRARTPGDWLDTSA